ncbi:MAG TPA: hypothetical protein VGJ21_15030 [Terracidiphilus sp.]
MPPSRPKNLRASLKRDADNLVQQILERRDAARATRAKALAKHPRPITIKTQITRPNLTAAATVPEQATASLQTAGYLLAIGDSWFDYPVHDVLSKLEDHYGYNIESSAHRGDPLEAIVSHVGQLYKFASHLDKVLSFGATPKAVLVSGGGDDIAGAEFGMLINSIDLTNPGWNDDIVAGVIDERIASAYRKLFFSINPLCKARLGHTVPILVHGYDYPVPDGRGFLGGWGPLPGPWLKPGFDEKLFVKIVDNAAMMTVLIDRFNTMLQSVSKEAGFDNVRYVDLRHTLPNSPTNYKKWWANELHPTGGSLLPGPNDGFLAVAAKFQAVLATIP